MKKIFPLFLLIMGIYVSAFALTPSDTIQSTYKENALDAGQSLRMAKIFIDEKNYIEAREILKSCLAKDSTNAQVLYNLAYVLDQMGFLHVAMIYYHRALDHDPTIWQSYRDIAYLFDVFNKLDSMQAYLNMAIKYAPVPESLFYDIGYCYDMMDTVDSAQVYYYKAIAFDSLDSQAYMNLGAIWGDRGYYDSARVYTLKSYSINPNEPEVCFNYGEILASQDSTEKAIDYYHRALELDTAMVAAQMQLGFLYESLGDSAMAHIYFANFVNSAPPIYLDDINRVREKLKEYPK